MSEPRDEFIDTIANEFKLRPLNAAEIESVLALAATAAHGTGDRTSAPLVSFIAGMAAAGSDTREDVLDRVRQKAGAITGPQGASAA